MSDRTELAILIAYIKMYKIIQEMTTQLAIHTASIPLNGIYGHLVDGDSGRQIAILINAKAIMEALPKTEHVEVFIANLCFSLTYAETLAMNTYRRKYG